MKKYFFFLLIAFSPLLIGAQDRLVIKNVSVVDVKLGEIAKDQTVVIQGNRIVSVSTSGKVAFNSTVVEGKGKYLIPGLWDMHVHDVCDSKWGKSVFMPMYIANGVTGVRDMGGPDSGIPDTVFARREEIKEGKLSGPHIVAAGYFIMGDVRGPTEVIRVSNNADGRNAVDFIKKAGADFIKVKELVSREAYFAIADEARIQNILLVGHVPFSLDAVEVVNAGQKSIEHMDGIWFTCSTEGNRLRQESFDSELKMFQGKMAQSAAFRKIMYALDTAMKTYSGQKADSAFHRFVSLNTFVCPTLTADQALANSADSIFQLDDRLKYIPASIAKGWDPRLNGRLKQLSTDDFEALKAYFQKNLQLVKSMKNAGIKFLAGTDTSPHPTSIPYLFPGFSLLDELELFANSGLSPLEALQTATINPAIFLNATDSIGTIEKGKIADLVLLNANPLENIRNTRKIEAVVMNGRLLQRKELDAMLNLAKELVSK